MSKHFNRELSCPKGDAQSPAIGQVLIIAFELPFKEALRARLDALLVPCIIKPHYDYPFWKFPGGMLRPGQTFPEALRAELVQETGAEADLNQIFLMYSGEKRLKPPHNGTFPVHLYAAFGCEFSRTHDITGDVGDEGEVVWKLRFGDITEEGRWGVPELDDGGVWNVAEKSDRVPFFAQYLRMLDFAKKTLG